VKHGSKTKRLPLVPGASVTAGMADKEFTSWMIAQGARPMSAKRREQLRNTGHWIDLSAAAPAA